MSELAKALARFQADVPHVAKGNTAEVPTKNGGKYKYDYADLTDVTEAILPLLAKHGFAWATMPSYSQYGFALHYELIHESGEKLEGWYPLPEAAPQEIGSAVTYARRYALCAVSGVAPGGDDDDAGKAQSAPRNRPTKEPWRERIDKALAAIAGAKDGDELDKVQDRARSLLGVQEVKDALAARREEVGPGTIDAWAVAEPGAS